MTSKKYNILRYGLPWVDSFRIIILDIITPRRKNGKGAWRQKIKKETDRFLEEKSGPDFFISRQSVLSSKSASSTASGGFLARMSYITGTIYSVMAVAYSKPPMQVTASG